jgi:hypothetical protein
MLQVTANFPISYSLDDTALAAALATHSDGVILLKRAFRFLLAVSTSGGYSVYSGELGKHTLATLKRFAKRGKLTIVDWPDALGDRPQSLTANLLVVSKPFSVGDVDIWRHDRKKMMTAGRGNGLTKQGKEQVLHDAAHICMFHGCGKRVDGIGGSPRPGNVGQLAHIVGADPCGPRGRDDSHALSDQPGNNMLVCYDHHRLIDVIDPESYTIADLQEMRRQHVQKVNDLLKQLAWPRVRPLIIRGGIAGQVPSVTMREVHDSLEDIQLTAGESEGEFLNMAPVERTATNYGANVLSQLKPSIARMITILQSGHYGPSNEDLAIYPIHDIPVLVLAGRIVGEGRTTRVFQRDRDRKTWRWQEPHKTTSDAAVATHCRTTAGHGVSTGILTIALSDRFQEGWLPQSMRSEIAAREVTWMSIEAEHPSFNIVKSPADHGHIMRGIREALRQLQSDFGVSSVSLIVVAPASIAFSIGQALQAGHHVPVTVYNRADAHSPFQPALRITARTVESADVASNAPVIVPLQ